MFWHRWLMISTCVVAYFSLDYGHSQTALHFASAKGHTEMAALLLNAGADVGAKNEGGVSCEFVRSALFVGMW